MRAAERADAQLTDTGWATTPLEARYEGNAAAETTTNTAQLIIYQFDLDALPTYPITITGVAVRIDAKKTDSGGTASLRIGAELSWNSGSGWTTQKSTALLTSTYATYILGSPDDLWGHAFTRGELASAGTFRIRLTALTSTAGGSPTWHIQYARPTAFYDRTSSFSQKIPGEVVAISEQVLTSPRVVMVREFLDVFDSGSSRTGAKVLGRQQQQLKLTGTAVTALQSSAGFPATILRPRHREGIGVRIRSEAIGLDMFIGDSMLLTQGSTLGYPANIMQPGMLDLGEVTSEGNFMGEQQATSCEVRLMNRYFVNQKAGASAVGRKLSEIVNNQAIVGGGLTVWSFAESGDGWVQYVIFDGVIEELDFEKSFFTIRGIAAGSGSIPVPDIFVDEDLFSYEPTSSALDTGEQVKGSKGRPVPIGLGRFDYGAVKLPTDFAAGHPFRVTFDPSAEDDRKNYTSIALFPSMFGLKHPMMPTIHVASRYRRVQANGTGEDTFTSFPYQNVFLYGSRKSSPNLGVATAPIGNIYRFDSQKFPGSDSIMSTGTFNQADYCLLWTWHQDDARSVGLPMVLFRDYGFKEEIVSNTVVPNFVRRHVGANFMEKLGYPNQLTSPNWTDGTARQAFAVFTNNLTPNLAQFPGIQRWPGVLQTIAIPMAGLTKRQVPTKLSLEDNIFSPTFATYEGVGQGRVENPRNCMDIADPENFTRIYNTGYMSLQCPLSGPALGKIRGVRVCILWNNTTSTAVNVYLYARFGPSVNYAFQRSSANPLNADFNRDFNALHNEADIVDTISGQPVPVYKLFNVDATPFASVWMLPDFDAAAGRPFVLFDDSTFEALVDPRNRYRPRKGRREWQFTSMDLATRDSFTYLEWPWDFMIDVRDLSGGVPIADRYFDLIAVWMEVVFESPLNGTAPEALVVNFAGGWERHYTGYAGPYNEQSYQWREQLPIHVSYEREARRTAPSPIYVTGKGAVDDANGTITGTAYNIIENPADMALALIRHYGGNREFSNAAAGTSFGSFATARTQLNSQGYRLTLVVDEAETLGQVLRRIAAQSHSLIQEQVTDLGETIWRMFVDVKPADVPTGRLYRPDGTDPFFFTADEMAEGTFKAELTRYEDISNQVSVQFGLHRPTRTYSDEKYVSPTASNFASGADIYKDALAEAQRQYGSTRRITITAPDVWDPLVAERLCKWHVDQVRRKRVAVEFETFANAMDLRPGHVIGIREQLVASDPDLGIPYPGDSAAWEVVRFTVTQVSIRKDAGQLARIFVRAEEIATEAT
jgi:hypothetical protein